MAGNNGGTIGTGTYGMPGAQTVAITYSGTYVANIKLAGGSFTLPRTGSTTEFGNADGTVTVGGANSNTPQYSYQPSSLVMSVYSTPGSPTTSAGTAYDTINAVNNGFTLTGGDGNGYIVLSPNAAQSSSGVASETQLTLKEGNNPSTGAPYTYQTGDLLFLITDDNSATPTNGAAPSITGELYTSTGVPLTNGSYFYDQSGQPWQIFYTGSVNYTANTYSTTGGNDVVLEAEGVPVPEASTLSMLGGAFFMGLGMLGYRRWFRKPEEEEEEKEEDGRSAKA
jgi:hypothetical protein